MGIVVDFTGVEASQGGGPLPEGEYVCVIDESKEVTSRQGTDGVEMKMRVAEGDCMGRFVWDRIWFTQAALGVARWKLQCARITIPEGSFTLNPANLVGRKVKVVVRHEEYDGKTRARVVGWEEASGTSASPAAQVHDDIPF